VGKKRIGKELESGKQEETEIGNEKTDANENRSHRLTVPQWTMRQFREVRRPSVDDDLHQLWIMLFALHVIDQQRWEVRNELTLLQMTVEINYIVHKSGRKTLGNERTIVVKEDRGGCRELVIQSDGDVRFLDERHTPS
jgi:hypothetical protein